MSQLLHQKVPKSSSPGVDTLHRHHAFLRSGSGVAFLSAPCFPYLLPSIMSGLGQFPFVPHVMSLTVQECTATFTERDVVFKACLCRGILALPLYSRHPSVLKLLYLENANTCLSFFPSVSSRATFNVAFYLN